MKILVVSGLAKNRANIAKLSQKSPVVQTPAETESTNIKDLLKRFEESELKRLKERKIGGQ